MTGGTQTKSQLLARKGTECQDPILNQGISLLSHPHLHTKYGASSLLMLIPRETVVHYCNCGVPSSCQELGLNHQENNFFHEASSRGGAHPHKALRSQNWKMLINNQRTSRQMRISWRLKGSIHAAAEALKNHPEGLLCICAVLYKTTPAHMGYMLLEPRKSGKDKKVVITKDINVSAVEHTYVSMDPLEAFCDEEGFWEVIFSCSCSCHFQISPRQASTNLESANTHGKCWIWLVQVMGETE